MNSRAITKLQNLVGPIGTRLVNCVFWNFIATLFTQGATFLVNIILARILGKQLFGEYSTVYNVFFIVISVAQFALGYTLTRYVAELRTKDKERASRIISLCFGIGLSLSLVGTVLLFFSSSFIAKTLCNAPELSPFLAYGSLFVFLTIMSNLFMGLLCGLEHYKQLAICTFAGAIAIIVAVYFGAVYWGIMGAIIGLVVCNICKFAVFGFVCYKSLRKENLLIIYKGCFNEFGAITKFTLPAAVGGHLAMPILFITNTILVRQSDGFKEMAVFTAANALRQLVLFLPLIINTVGLSVLYNIDEEKNKKTYLNVYFVSIVGITSSAIVGVLFMNIMGPYALGLFGKSFVADSGVLWILLLSIIPESLSIGLYQHLQSKKQLWQAFFYLTAPRELSFLILCILLIPTSPAQGMAIAYLGSRIICLVANIILSKSILSEMLKGVFQKLAGYWRITGHRVGSVEP